MFFSWIVITEKMFTEKPKLSYDVAHLFHLFNKLERISFITTLVFFLHSRTIFFFAIFMAYTRKSCNVFVFIKFFPVMLYSCLGDWKLLRNYSFRNCNHLQFVVFNPQTTFHLDHNCFCWYLIWSEQGKCSL